MEQAFDIQSYMTHGVERVVGEIVKATLKNPKESVYMARFALASRAASKKRRRAEDAREHIPAFLIASITSQCNLHCAGCYSRCNHATVDAAPVRQLTSGARVLPHQFPRRRGALPVLALLGYQRAGYFPQGSPAVAPVHGLAKRGHPEGRPRRRLCAV